MFRKPFHVKSNVQLKNSEKRKLREKLVNEMTGTCDPTTDELLSTAFSNKGDLKQVKIVTHLEESINVYSAQGVPIAFEVDSSLVPTVYLLWKVPDLVHTFLIHQATFRYLEAGADLMLPGVVFTGEIPMKEQLGHFVRGTVCSISMISSDGGSIQGPIAVGLTYMSSDDMIQSGMKGKGIHILHIFRDHLWEFGPKTQPLIRQITTIIPQVEEETENTEQQTEQEQASGGQDQVNELEVAESEPIEDEESAEDLLYRCFLAGLKYRLPKDQFPYDVGTFYSRCLLACMPEGKKLDMKKTKYKKFATFLKEVNSEEWIVKLVNKTKGVDMISEVNWDHGDIKYFKITDEIIKDEKKEDDRNEPPEITALYFATAQVLPVLRVCNPQINKGDAIVATEIRKILTDYSKKNELQSGSMVNLDPILSDTLRTRVEQMKWPELFAQFLKQMTAGFEIKWSDGRCQRRRGKMPQIILKVERRASNKHVTLVDNLIVFGIEPEEFSKKVRSELSCGTSVNNGDTNTEGKRVEIQGNQVNFVAQLLLEKYGLARKYVNGLDLGVKSKKK